MCSSLPINLHPSPLPQLMSSVINDWIPPKLWAVMSGSNRGLVFACWQPPRRHSLRSVLAQGLFMASYFLWNEELYTHTHRKRLRSLLDDKPLDNMCEDLGLYDGLWRFVLPVLRCAACHSGRFAVVSWGHGWRWGFCRSIGPLGWSLSWAKEEDNKIGWTQRCLLMDLM